MGEVTISQLTRKGMPIAVAAATSVLVVITTVVFASTTLVLQMIKSGGWTAAPWNLLCYDIPGVLIGGQIGPRLQGRNSPHTMRRAISVLFVILSVTMMSVAIRKLGIVQPHRRSNPYGLPQNFSGRRTRTSLSKSIMA